LFFAMIDTWQLPYSIVAFSVLAGADSAACDDGDEMFDEDDMLGDQASKGSPVQLLKRPGVQMASGMATTTPHHVMSTAAKAKLRSRVKTPGMPVSTK
jgi:hypothetical protein